MHLLVRDTVTLDEQDSAVDLGQSPADIVFLSFSDSDLGAMASAWQAMGNRRPTLRLASLSRLRHPMSVDLYVEQVIAQAKTVVIRLLGGLDYWRYGAEDVAAKCRAYGIALVMVEGDARTDERLAAFSTISHAKRERMASCLREGGPDNMRHALNLAMHCAGLADDDAAHASVLPVAGPYATATGGDEKHPRATIVFYRSHLLSGDTAPIEALADALRARDVAVTAHFVTSLKDPAARDYIVEHLATDRPSVVLNATGFSARDHGTSPLDVAGAPVLQLVLSGSSVAAWQTGFRGVSQTDLAMQVALPELDGRLLTTAISFKAEAETLPGLEFSRIVNRPYPSGIALAADRAAGWTRLATKPRRTRRIALVVSNYPGAGDAPNGQTAHAVGLDSFASIAAILRRLDGAGFDCGDYLPDPAELVHALCQAPALPCLDLPHYQRLFATLPDATQALIIAAWGEPDNDAALAGGFQFRLCRRGTFLIAVQPDRGNKVDRKSGYHDADLPPCHAYVAFYLWLRVTIGIDAMIHLGTHGTLEWLPGKAAALSDACLPSALLRGLPVLYPFIVNNPGEAAAAKRRLGAVTIGHLTPPLIEAGTNDATAALEHLVDEYAAADGLDRRHGPVLRRQILDRAAEAGLLAECGAPADAPDDVLLARLDAYLCDVKDMQIRDGLHIFATPPSGRTALLAALERGCPGFDPAILAERLDHSAEAEAASLIAGLDGRFVVPGPAGAPSRGRADVLPTGRNLATLDPNSLPTPTAVTLAATAAKVLLERHTQAEGDFLRRIVIDLWGSACLRTGGEDFALALLLLGVRPTWNAGSGRVGGFEIVPLALLDRPRVDVTLRISGLFRDAFESQIALFDAAVRAIAARDEAADWNPLADAARGLVGDAFRAATTRIFGAAPSRYGVPVADQLAGGCWENQAELGDAYRAASSNAYGQGLDGVADPAGFSARVAAAEAFLHVQDHAETDLLDSPEYAAHEGGFAAAAAALGAAPTLYHMDSSRPEVPRARTVAEDIARVVRARLANPRWIAGMMRHGYRGAAEIARGLDSLHGFAATMPTRFDRQFDLVFDATLGDLAVDAFLRAENPHARAAMAARFTEARRRDLWHPRRNDIDTEYNP